jgi:hypothetical protein
MIHRPSEIVEVWWEKKSSRFLIVKIPQKYLRESQMIDLHSIFHKGK